MWDHNKQTMQCATLVDNEHTWHRCNNTTVYCRDSDSWLCSGLNEWSLSDWKLQSGCILTYANHHL